MNDRPIHGEESIAPQNDLASHFAQVLVEHTPDALVAMSPKGEVLYWNNGATTLFGFSSADAMGRFLHELVAPATGAPDERTLLLEASSEGFATHESIRFRKDGSPVFVTSSTKAVYASDGSVKLFISSMKDVTSLKVQRDARLVGSKFRAVLDSTPDAIVMVNVTGRIVFVNKQAERMFGHTLEDLTGRPIEMLLPERFRGAHLRRLSSYFLQPHARPMGAGLELFGLRKNGEEFSVEISLSPLETEEGTLVMSAIRDITERKRIEQRLAVANKMKSEFLASMSHELRTPLNGIIGFSEFLCDEKPGPLNAKQKEYLNDVLNSGRHLLHIINDVLDLSKVEAGRMEMTPESFLVPSAIDEVCAVIAPVASGQNVRLRTKLSPHVSEVLLDQQKFKQVLYNLVSNAVKFTTSGGSVTVATTPHGDDSFKVRVSDTGIGIKTEDFERLFVEFQQLDSTIARQYGGTGLGLALTKKIVELKGGTIEVQSQLGKGSTFTVTLPRRMARGLAGGRAHSDS